VKDLGLFAERDPARAERIMRSLERYAERRERFINALDLAALDRATAVGILRDDETINETLAFATSYLDHLFALDAQQTDSS